MQNWLIWASAAGLVIILELFTGTFYLLMIAIGLAAGAFDALLGGGPASQMLVAAMVGALATTALHRSKFGKRRTLDATRDPNVNLDIGQSVAVQDWHSAADGRCRARVQYRGAQWDVELEPGLPCHAGQFRICEIRGSLLVVTPEPVPHRALP